MPMTITEKILARHAGLESVAPGDLVEVKVDLAFAHDFTAPIAIQVFREIGAPKVFDRKRVALVADHFVPNKDIASAEQAKLMREFAREQQLELYYEVGEAGIGHVLLPEQGLVVPGPGDHRGRQPHLRLRGPGGLFHRRGEHRHGRRDGHGRDLASRPADDPGRIHGGPCGRSWAERT